MGESILQQLGFAALPCPGRRHTQHGICENIHQVAALALSVEHTEMGEQPALQAVGVSLALAFQYVYGSPQLGNLSLNTT